MTSKKNITSEAVLSRLIQIFLCLLVLSRIMMAWKTANNVDTRYFVETAKLVSQGISPYNPETNPTIYKFPLQAPSMSLLSMPLC